MATTFIIRINTRVLASYHGFVGQNIKLYAQVAGKSLSRESVGDFIIHHPGFPRDDDDDFPPSAPPAAAAVAAAIWRPPTLWDDDLPPSAATIWRPPPRHDYFGEGVSGYQQMMG